MKSKILLLLALTLSAPIALAEFLVKIPLETFNGGSLPTNSISFVSNTDPDLSTPEKEIVFTIPANVNETYPSSDDICQASSYSNGVEVTQFYYDGCWMNGYNFFWCIYAKKGK